MGLAGLVKVKYRNDFVLAHNRTFTKIQIHQLILPFSTNSTFPPVRLEIPSS
jgi:hypothetical protein